MYESIRSFVAFFWELTRGRIAVALLLNVLSSLAEGASLFLILPLLTLLGGDQTGLVAKLPFLRQLLGESRLQLEPLLISFVIIVTVQAFFVRAKTLYTARVLAETMDKIRRGFVVQIGLARWETIQQRRIADLNTVLTTEIGRLQLAAASFTNIIQSTIMLGVYLAIALLVSWKMALFATMVGVMILAALYPVRRRATRYGRDLTEMHQMQSRSILEFLNGLRVVKSFLAEGLFVRRYARQIDLFRHRALDYVSLNALGTVIFQVTAALAAAAFVWMSIRIAQLDVAQLVVLVLIFLRLAPRFSGIQDALQNFLSNLPAFEKVRSELIELRAASEREGDRAAARIPLHHDIRFENVSLTYVGASEAALNELTFRIRAGQVTALIGPSGSGKSTIADVVMGLMSPTAGEVLIDGAELSADRRIAWRRSVAFVPQEPFLLHDTIRENLRIARPDVDEESIWAVLEQARAADFVARLPQGLDTLVGERGTRLSGGERQRVALARALLRKPELLILDEATSALDWENQQKIAADIEQLRHSTTILTIAHRPSMIRFADWVIAIENGRCVEQGAFEALARQPDSRLARMLKGEGA